MSERFPPQFASRLVIRSLVKVLDQEECTVLHRWSLSMQLLSFVRQRNFKWGTKILSFWGFHSVICSARA